MTSTPKGSEIRAITFAGSELGNSRSHPSALAIAWKVARITFRSDFLIFCDLTVPPATAPKPSRQTPISSPLCGGRSRRRRFVAVPGGDARHDSQPLERARRRRFRSLRRLRARLANQQMFLSLFRALQP